MMPPKYIIALAAIAPLAHAHFTFVRIAVNGEWGAPLQYVRNKTAPFVENPIPYTNRLERIYTEPTYATDKPNSVRCGRDNLAHGAETEVLKIKAGDTIEIAHQRGEPFEWTDDQFNNCANGYGTCYPSGATWRPDQGIYMDINHPGPLLIHLSQVPEGQDIHTYDGSGEWTKIFRLGLELREDGKSINWLPYNDQKQPPRFIFKIPEQTPAGQYLMRMDIIWSGMYYPPTNSINALAQMYPSCAQIEVESTASGPLPEGVKIPEIFDAEVPGMVTTLEMYRQNVLDANYTYPGGPLWDGVNLIDEKPVV